MDIDGMSNEQILRHLGRRFDSFIFSGANHEKSGVNVATLVKGKECLPFCRDDVEVKVKEFLDAKPPKKGEPPQFRVIK
jgi:hypothetical protein